MKWLNAVHVVRVLMSQSSNIMQMANAKHIAIDATRYSLRCKEKPVDNLWTTLPKRAQLIHIFASYLTRLLPSSSASERLKPCSSLRRLAVVGILCLFIGSLSLQMQPVQAATKADQYKLYAHSRVVDYKQFTCLYKIIYKESRWNPLAKNGSHFGLGQMKSQWYRNLDAYRQIDETIRYITKRYGSMCDAWDFHTRKGYF
jgi:hypothetical protein